MTGHVETTLANMEACRPAWARVMAVEENSTLLRGPALEATSGRLALTDEKERTLRFDPAIVPGLAIGDTLAVHGSHAALTLTPEQARALETYTRRSLDAANEALPGLRAVA